MFVENGGKVEGREVFIYCPWTGNTTKLKSMIEACRFLDLKGVSRSTVYRYADTGNTYKGYLIGFKRPKQKHKMAAYIEYWDKLKEELPPERWGRYNEKYLVSDWGRIKATKTNEFIIPHFIGRESRMVIRYLGDTLGVCRMVASVFILKREIKRNEKTVRKSGLGYECYPECINVVSEEEQRKFAQKRAVKSRRKECAKVNENGEIIEIYESRSEAARRNYMSFGNISKSIIRKGKAGGEIYKDTRSLF